MIIGPPDARRALIPRSAIRASVSAVLSVAALLAPLAGPADAQVPRGSPASLDRQNEQARLHDFSYLNTASEVRRFVDAGHLVPVRSNRDFDVHNVSFPYARPEVRLFIERLASQYRAACGEKLVVTSLTRPRAHQPENASARSVHPTGMAIDLRRPTNARCRNWLESTLIALARQGVIEAIHERNPPHYHIAVFPQPYVRHVAALTGQTRVASTASAESAVRADAEFHRVQRGETLTAIASRYGTTVGRIQSENGLRGTTIRVGQELRVPVYRTVVATAMTDEVPAALEAAASPALDAGTVRPDGPGGEAAPDVGAPTHPLHTVRAGESLWAIARRYGVTEPELRRANGIAGSRILAGQQLRIPVASTGGRSALLEHRVARGESLWTIAQAYGTTVEEIRERNGMDTTRILAGQVLEVPVGR